jgi:hypothetical protein
MLLIKRSMKQFENNTADRIILKIEDLSAELGVTIESSFYVNGEYDWITTFTAKDIIQAKKLSNAFVTLYPGVIEKISILHTLIFIKKHYILNPDKK